MPGWLFCVLAISGIAAFDSLVMHLVLEPLLARWRRKDKNAWQDDPILEIFKLTHYRKIVSVSTALNRNSVMQPATIPGVVAEDVFMLVSCN